MRVLKQIKSRLRRYDPATDRYKQRAPVVAALLVARGYERVAAVLVAEQHEDDPCKLYGSLYWWRRAEQVHAWFACAGGHVGAKAWPFPSAEPRRRLPEVDAEPAHRDVDNRDCVHFEACLCPAARGDMRSVCGGRVREECSQYLSRDSATWREDWVAMMVHSDAIGLGEQDADEWDRRGC